MKKKGLCVFSGPKMREFRSFFLIIKSLQIQRKAVTSQKFFLFFENGNYAWNKNCFSDFPCFLHTVYLVNIVLCMFNCNAAF